MHSATRRLLAFIAVFATAFIIVSALRTSHAGSGFRDWLTGLTKGADKAHPESFTLPDKPPLELGDVELLARLNDEYASVTRAVVPAVVSINTAGIRTEQLPDVWGRTWVRRYPTQGQGSGVIVTKEGHVVTNHHVIADQQQIRVTLHGGKTHPAHLIGEDTLLDIAVLKIDANESFTPLKFGDSSQAQVGQIVFAVGNPFGLGETVTHGIISAKERSLSDNQRELFQTDAAINPGNSGGPLVNLRGEIIGINVAIFSSNKDNPGFQGVGFSLPANDVKNALAQILQNGRPAIAGSGAEQPTTSQPARPGTQEHRSDPEQVLQAIGIEVRDLSVLERLQGFRGVVVMDIAAEGLAAGRIQAGDLIIAVNAARVSVVIEFYTRLAASAAVQDTQLQIIRDGKSMRVTLPAMPGTQ